MSVPKNLVEVYPEVEHVYTKIALNLLPRLNLEDEQMIILASGLPHFEQLKKNNTLLLGDLIEFFDLINPFEYNTIFITKNGGFRPKYDDPKYGSKLSISFGEWSGNDLLIDGEHVHDLNRLVAYDGTKLLSETTPHISGTKYNITFYHVCNSACGR
jgi:hypothetical protein